MDCPGGPIDEPEVEIIEHKGNCFEKYWGAKMTSEKKIEKLRAALLVVLDQVDYTKNACGVTEMVGAVLPASVINQARRVLEETK